MRLPRIVRFAVWGMAVATATAAAAWLATPARVVGIAAAVEPWALPLTVLRVAGIAALWIWWPRAVRALPGLGEDGREYLLGRRTFYVAALCAIELLFLQDAVGSAGRLLDGWLSTAPTSPAVVPPRA